MSANTQIARVQTRSCTIEANGIVDIIGKSVGSADCASDGAYE
jgi:hypothetical protein